MSEVSPRWFPPYRDHETGLLIVDENMDTGPWPKGRAECAM